MFIVLPRFRTRVSVFALPTLMLIFWLEGFAPFVVMLASAAVHELGHLMTMKSLGYRMRRIDILPMGALIVLPEGVSYRDELKIAFSGPLASLLCALLSLALFLTTNSVLALFAACSNLVLALFNLLPERKLDGGKALYYYLLIKTNPETAEKVSSTASAVSSAVFVSLFLLCITLTNRNLGIILISLTLLTQLFQKEKDFA